MELNERKLLSLKSWKELAEKGEAPKDAVVLVSVDIPDVKQLSRFGKLTGKKVGSTAHKFGNL